MPCAFTDEEVKGKLRDAIEHGDPAEISRRSGIAYGMVKRQFDAESDVPSFAFQFLQIACAEHEIDPDRGDDLVDRFVEMYEQSKQRNRSESRSIGNSLCESTQLIAEVMANRLGENVTYDQLTKMQKVARLVVLIRRGLMEETQAQPLGRLSPER